MIYRCVKTPIRRVFPIQSFYNKTCVDDARDDTSISSSHNVCFNGCYVASYLATNTQMLARSMNRQNFHAKNFFISSIDCIIINKLKYLNLEIEYKIIQYLGPIFLCNS